MKRILRALALLLTARCDHASLEGSDAWDGPVARERRWAAWLHRATCAPCREEHRRMTWLRRVLAEVPESFRHAEARAADSQLSESACQRISAALAAARRAEHGPSDPDDSAESL